MMVAPEYSPPLFTDDYYQNPYPTFQWLRDNSPVHEFDFPVGGTRTWIVTRFDDVQAMLTDPRISSDGVTWANQRFKDSGMVMGSETLMSRVMTVLDPPYHTRLRKMVMSAFTPRQIGRWEEPAVRVVDAALDRLERRERPDVMEFAAVVPAQVIGQVLGMPLGRAEEMHLAIQRAFSPDPDNTADVGRAFEEIVEYGRELVAAKRRDLSDDLLSMFIRARDGEDRLSEDELIAMLTMLLIAGLDTTTFLIGNAILALLDHPEQRREFTDRPAVVDDAIEEFLRYEGPAVTALFRFTKEDMEIAGVPIPANSPVIAALQSANRDPRRFTEPDRLHFGRADAGHVGLGHGLHNCLGAALARLEARIAIPAFFHRFPNVELAIPRSEIRYGPNWLIRRIEKLPVSLHSSRRADP